MNIVYTKHALKRIKFRKIEEIWVEEAIKYPSSTKREGNRYFVRKKLNGKTIEVVCIKEKDINIKTTYWV